MEMTRGERNNNPGNIRNNDIKFQGEAEGNDPDFKTFETSFFGIRAIAKILLVYFHSYGLNTVEGIISRWAPGNENDTGAYIADVAARCNINPTDIIDCEEDKTMDNLVTAIIFHENGRISYSSNEIIMAVDAALGA